MTLDGQRALAIIFFLLISLLMGLAFRNPEKAGAFISRIYGIVGIRVEFRGRGLTTIRVVSGFLALLFLFGAIAVAAIG